MFSYVSHLQVQRYSFCDKNETNRKKTNHPQKVYERKKLYKITPHPNANYLIIATNFRTTSIYPCYDLINGGVLYNKIKLFLATPRAHLEN